jgi:hypothetical protein
MLKVHPSLSRFAEARARRAGVLSPCKTCYLVPLADGFFATVQISSAPLLSRPHILSLYYAPKATTVSQARTPSNLILKQFTTPFLFPSSSDAQQAIRSTLIDIAESYE